VPVLPADEIWTQFAVTVDYYTKENNTVTLRDSMKQVRIAIEKRPGTLAALVEGSVTFAEIW
jgi:glycyl-tRNA synthetase